MAQNQPCWGGPNLVVECNGLRALWPEASTVRVLVVSTLIDGAWRQVSWLQVDRGRFEKGRPEIHAHNRKSMITQQKGLI